MRREGGRREGGRAEEKCTAPPPRVLVPENIDRSDVLLPFLLFVRTPLLLLPAQISSNEMVCESIISADAELTAESGRLCGII